MITDRIFGFLQKIEDYDVQLRHRLLKPLMEKYGVDIKLTTNRAERIFDLTDILITIDAESPIEEMYFALGGDDGDLDEVAEALDNLPFLGL